MEIDASSAHEQSSSEHVARMHQHSSAYWHERIREYSVAIAFAAVLFAIFSAYLYGRRGFYDLYIINKIFAGIAAVQLGMLLLMGPLSRMFDAFDRFLRYRKEFGIVAFFFAAAHWFSSFFFLPDKFPLDWFLTKERWSFYFALAGAAVLTAIFAISNRYAVRALDPHRWWFLQRWGVRAAFALIILHIAIMKVPGWLDWYQNGGSITLAHPEWPGLGILVGWFMAAVFIVRIGEAISNRAGKIAWYGCAILLPLIYVLTFVWGRQFLS